MESFDQRGGLDDRLGEHRTEVISPELSWERMGPAIRARVAERQRRRRPWFFWLALLAGIALALWWRSADPTDSPLGAFPLPLPVASPVVTQPPGLAPGPATQLPADASLRFGPGAASHATADTEDIVSGLSNGVASARHDRFGAAHPEPPKGPPRSQRGALARAEAREERLPQRSVTAVASLPTSPLTAIATTGPSELLLPVVIPDRFGTGPAPWRLIMSGGINTADWDYPLPADTDLDPAAYHTARPGWQASLRIERHWRGPWSVGTGLQVQRLRYRSAFATAERTNLYRPGTIDTIFVNPITGSETYRYRDSVPGVRIRRFQHHNYRTSWRVPLYLAYTWRGGNWAVGLAAGLNAELGRHQTGRVALATDRVQALSATPTTRPTLRGSAWLEARLTVPLTSRIAVQSRFGYDRDWRAAPLPGTTATQRPAALYGTVGLSWSPR